MQRIERLSSKISLCVLEGLHFTVLCINPINVSPFLGKRFCKRLGCHGMSKLYVAALLFLIQEVEDKRSTLSIDRDNCWTIQNW
jgi:hypothetical protein